MQKGRDDERQSWTAPRLALTTGQMVQMVQKVQASEKYRLTQTRARFTPQRTKARPERSCPIWVFHLYDSRFTNHTSEQVVMKSAQPTRELDMCTRKVYIPG